MDQNRRKRIRKLLSELNRTRRRQAMQIDILCNDMVSAHKDFMERIHNLSFINTYYESLLGIKDCKRILDITAEYIRQRIDQVNVAVFLKEGDDLQIHCISSQSPIDIDTKQLEQFFTPQIIDMICRSNTICSLDDMFLMGIQGQIDFLDRICAAAIPIGNMACNQGFILVYRQAERIICPEELKILSTITSGLSRSLQHIDTVSPSKMS